MATTKAYRQGDVIYIPTKESVPKEAVEKSDHIIAHGEVTGHKHELVKELEGGETEKITGSKDGVHLYEKGDVLFMQIDKGKKAKLVHEEHDSHDIPPGKYDVKIQQKYTPTSVGRVVD